MPFWSQTWTKSLSVFSKQIRPQSFIGMIWACSALLFASTACDFSPTLRIRHIHRHATQNLAVPPSVRCSAKQRKAQSPYTATSLLATTNTSSKDRRSRPLRSFSILQFKIWLAELSRRLLWWIVGWLPLTSIIKSALRWYAFSASRAELGAAIGLMREVVLPVCTGALAVAELREEVCSLSPPLPPPTPSLSHTSNLSRSLACSLFLSLPLLLSLSLSLARSLSHTLSLSLALTLAECALLGCILTCMHLSESI